MPAAESAVYDDQDAISVAKRTGSENHVTKPVTVPEACVMDPSQGVVLLYKYVFDINEFTFRYFGT